MMVELISPQVRPLGRKDGYKVGERKDKLESMSINWNLWWHTRTHVGSHYLQTWWCVCPVGEEGALCYLAQKSKKLKEDLGKGGEGASLLSQVNDMCQQSATKFLGCKPPVQILQVYGYSCCFSSTLQISCKNACCGPLCLERNSGKCSSP